MSLKRKKDVSEVRLKLVFIYFPDLIRLNTKIFQRLPLRRMIEADHQPWQISAKCYTLVVTPSFSQCVASKVTFQINCPAPLFDQPDYRWNDQNFGTLALEDIIRIFEWP